MQKRDLSDIYGDDKISLKEINVIKWMKYFEELQSPVHINDIFTMAEQHQLNEIARNIRGQFSEHEKDMLFNQIMTSKGFTRFTSGTNRIMYSLPQYPQLLFKVAYDIAGCSDSPREFVNQQLFKPFVPKVIEVNSLGNIAINERVIAFSRLDQFCNCAKGPNGIYYIIRNVLIQGKYALSDIGIKNWANWGYREGFGPVLLDFPYVYEIDPNKVWCTNITKEGTQCTGKYQYDDKFDKIVCSKCGATILPSALATGEYFNSARAGMPELVDRENTQGGIIRSDTTKKNTRMTLVFKRGDTVLNSVTTANKINYI